MIILPAKQHWLMLVLIRCPPQAEMILYPDTYLRQVKPGIIKCFAEIKSPRVCVKNVYACMVGHVQEHTAKRLQQKIRKFLCAHAVILDFSGHAFIVHIVGRVCYYQIGFLIGHQFLVRAFFRAVSAVKRVLPQVPKIPGLSQQGLREFRVYVKFIIFNFRREEIFNFKACQGYIYISEFQLIHQKLQLSHVPVARYFIQRNIQCLLLFIGKVNYHASRFLFSKLY